MQWQHADSTRNSTRRLKRSALRDLDAPEEEEYTWVGLEPQNGRPVGQKAPRRAQPPYAQPRAEAPPGGQRNAQGGAWSRSRNQVGLTNPRAESPNIVDWNRYSLVKTSWIDHNEVMAAYRLLYSKDPQMKERGVAMLDAWATRVVHLPVGVEATQAIVSVQAKDLNNALDSETLRRLYALSVIRFINGVVDPFRIEMSIADKARSLGIPLWVTDVRHCSTHGELPETGKLLKVVEFMLEWLDRHFWRCVVGFERSYENIVARFIDTYSRGYRRWKRRNGGQLGELVTMCRALMKSYGAEFSATYFVEQLVSNEKFCKVTIDPQSLTFPLEYASFWRPLILALGSSWKTLVPVLISTLLYKLSQANHDPPDSSGSGQMRRRERAFNDAGKSVGNGEAIALDTDAISPTQVPGKRDSEKGWWATDDPCSEVVLASSWLVSIYAWIAETPQAFKAANSPEDFPEMSLSKSLSWLLCNLHVHMFPFFNKAVHYLTSPEDELLDMFATLTHASKGSTPSPKMVEELKLKFRLQTGADLPPGASLDTTARNHRCKPLHTRGNLANLRALRSESSEGRRGSGIPGADSNIVEVDRDESEARGEWKKEETECNPPIRTLREMREHRIAPKRSEVSRRKGRIVYPETWRTLPLIKEVSFPPERPWHFDTAARPVRKAVDRYIVTKKKARESCSHEMLRLRLSFDSSGVEIHRGIISDQHNGREMEEDMRDADHVEVVELLDTCRSLRKTFMYTLQDLESIHPSFSSGIAN